MPRQTNEKSIIFPDGFKFGIDTGDGFEDVGILAGGATCTFNWDDFSLDAGNYEQLLDYAKNPTVALAPSAIWNWNPTVINKLMLGFTKKTDATSPTTGTDLEFNGTAKHFTLNRASLRLIHFDDFVDVTLTADDITLQVDSVNEYVKIPKTAFSGALDWTVNIDGYVEIEGMTETTYSSLNSTDAIGKFYAGADDNLYLIYAVGTFTDEPDAKSTMAGTVIRAYTSVDWAFTLYNAKIDAGANMNFKGMNEDGLSEYTVSFTGKPDPSESYRLFRFFRA